MIAATADPSTAPPLRVLIVDDDAGDRKLLQRDLERCGRPVEALLASSIEQVFPLDPDSVDCALVDYRLPGVDGLEGIHRIRAECPYLAVVLVTGEGDELLARRAIKEGATDYIPKSAVEPEFLRRVVTNAVDSASLRRSIDEQRQELEHFAHLLAHDLRAPAWRIKTFSEFLQEALEGSRWDEAREMVTTIGGCAAHLQRLVGTLHGYTRGLREAPTRPVELRHVLDSALRVLDDVVQSTGAEISYGASLPTVEGNEEQLVQLFQNLLGNSIKYCRGVTPRITVAASLADDTCRVVVEDNGIGISEDDREAVFEPFRRLHDEGEFGGTGLGLAACRKVAERHGGRIWCEDAPGGGTRMYVELPVAALSSPPATSSGS